ncbi:MAG: type II toxin-antitoxin system HigB family toxin [bacterium]|nr:type II toxin-antitoxin system HigB family toxin [bacterium]
MHIITRKRLNDFAAAHPETHSALERWYRLAKRRNFSSFEDFRSSFSSVDKVGKLTVFNIGGNKARLIVAMHYNRRKIYIRAVLTHDEYDHDTWKE